MARAGYSGQVIDDKGNVVPGAQIRVQRLTAGLSSPQLYDARDGGNALGNPFAANNDGSFTFFVSPGGAFKITATAVIGGQVWSKEVPYVAIGTASEFDIESLNKSALIVRAATTANITIATALNNGDTQDNVTLATNDLVMVGNQTTKSENGIYKVGSSPERVAPYDAWQSHIGLSVYVREGTANAGKAFVCAANQGGVIGTDALEFVAISSSVVAPLVLDANGVPGPHLDVLRDDGTGQADISATTYSVNGGGIFHGRFARGNRNSPSHALAGDIVAGIGGRAFHQGGAFQSSSPTSIHWVASEDQSESGFGSYLRILTTPKGSTVRHERVIVSDTGTLWAHDTSPFDPKVSAQSKPISDLCVLASGCGLSGQFGVSVGAFFYGEGTGGGTPGFRGGGSMGTPDVPAASIQHQMLCFVGGHGHDGAGWTAGTKALIALYAEENFTPVAQGTRISLQTTPVGSTARAEVARFDKPVTAGFTGMMLFDVDNNTLERVTVGDADSGGLGYKVLRIPN